MEIGYYSYYDEFVEETSDENGEVDNNFYQLWMIEKGYIKENPAWNNF